MCVCVRHACRSEVRERVPCKSVLVKEVCVKVWCVCVKESCVQVLWMKDVR